MLTKITKFIHFSELPVVILPSSYNCILPFLGARPPTFPVALFYPYFDSVNFRAFTLPDYPSHINLFNYSINL